MSLRRGAAFVVFAAAGLNVGAAEHAVAARGSAAPLGSIRHIIHRVTVAPPHGRVGSGRVRQPLFAQYGLATGKPDRAAITFSDGSVLDINRNTSLVLRSATLTSLSRGEVSVSDSPGSHHVVTTASAVATAIGTLFDVRIEIGQSAGPYTPTPATRFPAGTTTVSVVQGVVRVSNRLGRVSVRAGQWTHVAPGRAPTPPTTHNASQDVAWSSVLKP